MIYNLSNKNEQKQAYAKLLELGEQGVMVEIKRKYPKRSNQQNAYLHVLFTLWAIEYGYMIEESKTIVKRELGYVYEKGGYKFVSATSRMDSKELSDFIDKFRRWSNEMGCYLPTADEYQGKWQWYQNEIERHSKYI